MKNFSRFLLGFYLMSSTFFQFASADALRAKCDGWGSSYLVVVHDNMTSATVTLNTNDPNLYKKYEMKCMGMINNLSRYKGAFVCSSGDPEWHRFDRDENGEMFFDSIIQCHKLR